MTDDRRRKDWDSLTGGGGAPRRPTKPGTKPATGDGERAAGAPRKPGRDTTDKPPPKDGK